MKRLLSFGSPSMGIPINTTRCFFSSLKRFYIVTDPCIRFQSVAVFLVNSQQNPLYFTYCHVQGISLGFDAGRYKLEEFPFGSKGNISFCKMI